VVDESVQPVPVPSIIPESDLEKEHLKLP